MELNEKIELKLNFWKIVGAAFLIGLTLGFLIGAKVF